MATIMNAPTQYLSPVWGATQFFPVSGKAVGAKCRHCILQRTDSDCLAAPCEPSERTDGQSGYFSIHQMPNV